MPETTKAPSKEAMEAAYEALDVFVAEAIKKVVNHETAALRERNRALVEALRVIVERGYHGASYVAQLALAADAKAGEDR